ncbi:MAG TPA: DNA repair exonuclease [Actinospica sp.]|jgi:DNA repair exonuclease SbcCD nuclease subunit|nr:DNA repair exonuclease [Actinospica sp.]
MKLLHAADLHIDSPLQGLEKYPDAPADSIRAATREATENLVALALAEQVDAVLLAGDIYDGEWRGFDTGIFFQRQMHRLAEAGIPVYLVSGNHDAASQISRTLSLPPNVHAFDIHGPETHVDDKLGLAVHGQGYVRRDVTDNLAVNYPPARAGYFNVGLLHTALNGREGHDRYAPCTIDQLAAHNYGYWALGHVHAREEVSREPLVVFPGNIQGRHAKEKGFKSCALVTVESDGVQVEHRALDVVRWEQVEVDASKAANVDDVCELVRSALAGAKASASGRLLAARVRLTGRSDAHLRLWRERERLTHEVRTIGYYVGEVWVEKVCVETRPGAAAEPGRITGTELIENVVRTANELGKDSNGLRDLITKDALWNKLPPQVRGENGLWADDERWCADLLGEASELLASMMEERD